MQPLPLHLWGRTLILAPHPDDESLAVGGLIQQLLAAGAEIKVIFLTGGDNNPWPQRAIEWRWKIAATDRKRWQARRHLEVVAALTKLGVSESSTVFWEFPDQGLTNLLLAGNDEFPQRLIAEIRDWQPMVLVTPSPLDLHADHSASAVFARLALARLNIDHSRPMHIEYVVHWRGPLHPAPSLTLNLTRGQQERKRSAIQCHASQLKLRRSLPEIARPTEEFFSPEEINNFRYYPVKQVTIAGGEMEIELQLSFCPGAFGRATLHLASYLKGRPTALLSLTLPRRGSKAIDIRDIVQDRVVAQARLWDGHRCSTLKVPLTVFASSDFVVAKVERQFGFFDQAGWCELQT